MQWVIDRLDDYAGYWFKPCDPRSLALFRIVFSVACLANLSNHWGSRAELYYPKGLFGPDFWETETAFSVFRWFREPWMIDVLFGVGFVAAICVGLGYMTRLAAIYLAVLYYSYLTRIWLLSSGWDTLGLTLVYLTVYSPTDARWSVRSWLMKRRTGVQIATIPAYPLRILQWQFMLLFVATTWLKTGGSVWRDGIESGHFLLGGFSNTHTLFLIQHQVLNLLLTHLTLIIELTVPFLLWHRRTRVLGFVLFGGLMGVLCTSKILPYPLTVFAMGFVFLEGRDLDLIAKVWRKESSWDLVRLVARECWRGVRAIFGAHSPRLG